MIATADSIPAGRQGYPRRPARPRLGMRLTRVGAAFLAALSVTLVVALQQSNNILVILLGMFLGSFLLNWLAGWRAFRAVTVTRVRPDAAVAGAPSVIRYRLRNPRRWGRAYSLHLVDMTVNPVTGAKRAVEAYVPALRPQCEVTISVPVVWAARGRVDFQELRLSSQFPFGLIRKLRRVPAADSLFVYPALGALRGSVWNLVRAAEQRCGGEAGGDRGGGDDEFFGLRQYRHGDNPRRIHWRRTARTGEIYVREMSRPRMRQIWCILNTGAAPRDRAGRDRIELAVSCAATVACDVLEHAGKVGLVAGGAPWLASPPGGGRELRSRLLRELALREPGGDEPLWLGLSRMQWPSRWRGPCLLISPVHDDDVVRSGQWLAKHVGPVTLLIPGTIAFDSFFAPRAPGAARWDDLSPSESPLATAARTQAA